jgi:large subunit ribosomal protein L10
LALTVEDAINKAKKEQTVERLEAAFKSSAVVFGTRFQNLSVKQQEQFRHSLPAESQLIVCKNTLLKLAAERVGEEWTVLNEAAKGENAWVFVSEEKIADTVKAYMAFETALKETVPKEQRKDFHPCDVSGAAMQGKSLDAAAFKRLEKLPTREELYAKIAALIKMVPTKMAKSIKMVPTKLALSVKQLADGDDNKELIVGELFPKAAAASE